MRRAPTAIVSDQPTSSELALAERQESIRLPEAGWTAPAIAEHRSSSVRTVHRWRSAHRTGGAPALAYHGCRPHTRASYTTPPAVIDQSVAIRSAHPGWGAYRIQRQLRLDGAPAWQAGDTIQHWRGRRGYPRVRKPAQKLELPRFRGRFSAWG